MIYFFDNELNMVKVTTSKNVISAVHEHELNGLILGTLETDLSYTEAFINDVDYFGYYYKDNYYLHKIKRVEHEHENELVRITGRHIFFEDMLYGDYIRDVRPVNRDALYILNQTISANTRWQTVMTDTSKLHSETYYWVPPMEVLNDLTENVGIEYEPKILFDGHNINGFQLHVANRIGEDTPIRVPFGSRVLNLKYEVDYSEIVTALYGHGKGEEVGDGYGRRINFSSVNFSRNGVVSPVGQLYMENLDVTDQYGKDDGSPKFGRIIFEDIESTSELANATYEAYLEQSRPKMLFEASVVDLGDVGMGDGVLIIRREYDVYFNARIHKLMVDLLDAENADVELGDYAHFKESKVQRKTRENNNQYRRETSSRIQQLKEQFNDRFDGEVNQMREDFEQALIDAHAEIQASEQRMTELIGDERASLQTEIDDKTNDAREYADTQIADKEAQYEDDWNQRDADIQQSIETVVGGSVDALDTNLLDVNSRLFQTRNDLIERINNIDTQSFNLIRGSRFDEPDRYATSGGTVHDDEDMPYFRYGISSGDIQYISIVDDIQFEAGKTYTLSLDYRTSSDVSIDYLHIIPTDGSADINIREHIGDSDMAGIIPDGEWHRTFLTFTVPRNLTGNLRLGSDFTNGTKAQIDIRLPYLTTSDNTQWVFHPSDSYESIMSIMTRLDEFEARVENDLAGVSGELSTARSELQQQLDDAKAELEGIEYENRNLFVQSSELDRLAEIDDREVLKTRGYFNNSGELASGDPLIIKRDLLSGATYTLSGRFNAPNHPSVPNHNNILLHHENGIINVGKFPPHYENHSFTFRVPENLTQTFLAFDTGVYDAYIEKDTLKLERGKKATPYSKAPEDTEHKITTLNQQIEYIDGELEAKLNRTEIEPIQNKITEYGLTLDANAESIGLLQEKTELHDGDITKWSNLTESNAEEIGRTLTRLSDIDGNIERAETDIYVNAESIGGLLTRTSEAEQSIADINISVDGISADFANYKQDIDSDVGTLSAQVASYEANVDGFRAEVGTLQGDIDGVDNWIADKGAVIDGNADAIRTRIWKNDIDAIEVGGRNLIPNSSNLLDWSKWSLNTSVIKMPRGMHRVSRGNPAMGGAIGIHSKGSFVLKAGNEYTISYKAHDFYGALPNYIYILSSEQGNTQLSNLDIKLLGRTGTLVNQSLYANQYKLTFTFTKDVKDGQILIGYEGGTTSKPNIGFYISDVQLEKGNKSTDWSPAPEDSLMKTDFILESDGFFLGGNYVGGEHYSTAIVGDADGLKLLGDTIIDGNLYVKDRVQSFAMEAVEGEFAQLWADEFEAITITGDHIDGNTITGNHLSVDKAMVDKLIADTAFVDEIKATSIDAVHADLRSVNSEIMTSNIIKSDWLDVDVALANKFNANTAFIDSLEVKAANIRDLTGIHIRGGMLDSLNGRTSFNLDTGLLQMDNTDFRLGGNAHIRFTNRNNRLIYSNVGISAGLQFDHTIGTNNPMIGIGVSDGGFSMNDSTFRGIRIHSLGSEGSNADGTNIISQEFGVYSVADASGSGYKFKLHAFDGVRGIHPISTGRFNYDLGQSSNRWRRVYLDDLFTGGDGRITIQDTGSSGGYFFDTRLRNDGFNITFRGINTSSNSYNIGNSNFRFSYIYLRYAPNVQSDGRLKQDIHHNKLGLDFIRDLETKSFRMKPEGSEFKASAVQYGIIAQQFESALQKHGVDTEDLTMLTRNDGGYYGVQYEQLIAPTIKAVQDLDVKVESNAEKIKRLEKEIETLKGA